MDTIKFVAEKEPINENQIISLYMNDVLTQENQRLNVYSFCKKNTINEPDFYSFFGSLEAVQNRIWVKFFENAVHTIEKEDSYLGYSNKISY